MGYIFDPDVFQAVAKEAVAKGIPLAEMIEFITEELDKKYPGHIQKTQNWFFNNAGGAMGHMTLLHASITEYVIIFGSPIGTEGHSGRFPAEDFFNVIQGEHWCYAEGQLERTVTRAGEMSHMPSGVAHGYRIPEECYALEYARGAIPLMLPFGFADVFSSTLDIHALVRTLWGYTKCTVSELMKGKI